MKKTYRLSGLLGLVLLVAQQRTTAQNTPVPAVHSKPIPVEGLIGTNRFNFQTVINKTYDKKGKLGFLSVTSAAADYDNKPENFDFINTSQISYAFFKGIAITAGISIGAKTGLGPTIGMHYVHADPVWLLVLSPGLQFTKPYSVQGLGIVEYKPRINEIWAVYSRLQGFYNDNITDNVHARSYAEARLGLSWNQLGFGLGANWDWYGPTKIYKDNYGLYVRYSFN